MEGVGASETLAGMAETDDQKTASERQPALPAEVSGSRTHEPERELDPPSSPAPLTNEEAPRGSSQTAPMESGTEAPITSRPSTPVNTRYSLPRSRPTSPVPSLKNFESVRPSSPQRPDSPLEPSRTGLEKASGSPRANSPFLQKAQSFGRSNVSAKRISSMLVEKRGHSGLRADYEEDQVSPRAFEVKPLADTDGLCAVLYHYLWRKTGKGKGCPGLNLPDTIVYRYRQPMHWFFTSVHDGQVRLSSTAQVAI